MKILVFDDDLHNRQAALAQLQDHDVTVVGTYDEAQNRLVPKANNTMVDDIFEEKYGDRDPYRDEGLTVEQRRERIDFYHNEACEQATTYPDFDVVLVDLLVPASRQSQGGAGRDLVGKEMPLGIMIGLLAATKGRAKYIAVFTDSDHHSHPASACFDVFNAGETEPTPFMVEESKMLLSNTRAWVDHFDPNDLARPLSFDFRKDTVRAKNWAALLEYLLKVAK